MDNISGATILGNGKIALVLDTNNVIEQFLNKKSV
jgi:chemotaxis protein histidine kinase CheA